MSIWKIGLTLSLLVSGTVSAQDSPIPPRPVRAYLTSGDELLTLELIKMTDACSDSIWRQHHMFIDISNERDMSAYDGLVRACVDASRPNPPSTSKPLIDQPQGWGNAAEKKN